ncbi:MAG: lyase family protein [Bdellovibrionales bacterium]
MAVHLFDSQIYGSNWIRPDVAAIFDEKAKIAQWLEILRALAKAQLECGILTADEYSRIDQACKIENLDFEAWAEDCRKTGHSLAGLIRLLQVDNLLFGMTVQDLTDTWMAGAMVSLWKILSEDLLRIGERLIDLSEKHKEDLVLGRTHGQAGKPITLGFKIAIWVAEVQRHLGRLKDCWPNLAVGQLSGAVGSASVFGVKYGLVQERFFAQLGLMRPTISWTTSRDVWLDFSGCMILASGTLAKIGEEIYNLQRTEINEAMEPRTSEYVGSITMPHKRNPEICEQIVTLWRQARASYSVLLESQVHHHERDGRSWKAEWMSLPDLAIFVTTQTLLALKVLNGLEFKTGVMRSRLSKEGDFWASEALMIGLAKKMGLKRARQEVALLCEKAGREQSTLKTQALKHPPLSALLSSGELETLFRPEDQTSACKDMQARSIEEGKRALEDFQNFLKSI